MTGVGKSASTGTVEEHPQTIAALRGTKIQLGLTRNFPVIEPILRFWTALA